MVKHGSTQLLSWWNLWNDTNSYQLISRILSKNCQWCQDDIELLISIDDNDVKCKNAINLGHSSASKVPPTSRYVQIRPVRHKYHANHAMTPWPPEASRVSASKSGIEVQSPGLWSKSQDQIVLCSNMLHHFISCSSGSSCSQSKWLV